MKERQRIQKHPWQKIQKPFAFKAWKRRNRFKSFVTEKKYAERHPELR